MGRQHRHTREKTVERAMNLFWRNGFSGTSLRDLENCLDMRPGSIYARFGNKEHLYGEAMELYAAKTCAIFQSHMEKAESFRAGLRHFIEQLLFTPNDPCCCMLAKTLIQTTPDNNALKRKADKMIADFENYLVIQLEKARTSGEIKKECDTRALARFIQVQIIGIRFYAEMKPPRKLITAVLNDVMKAIANTEITEF